MDWISPVLEWLRAHVLWVGPLLGVAAFTESLALVGLFVPGAVLMFAAGALVGTGYLDFWPLYWWAVVGAFAGDGLSFWFGHYFRGGLRRRWPFTRYPGLLERAVRFFADHGGKSVILGRFVGPIRPIIPAVAGMLDMSAWRFFAINLTSALLWAPAYLLPGVVFGVSLSVAASVATRLSILVVAAAVLLWLLWRLPGWLQPLLSRGVARLARTNGSRLWWRLLRGSRHGAGFLWWVALLVLVAVCVTVALSDGPAHWEQVSTAVIEVHRSAALRLPLWLLTQLGGTPVILLATLAVAAFLLLIHRFGSALGYLASVAGTLTMGYVLKAVFGLARPGSLTGAGFGYAFPSGHSFAVTVFLVATVVLVTASRQRHRAWLLAAAGGLAGVVALSRVGLGVHWPLDVIAGVALGCVGGGLVALLGPGRCPQRWRWWVLSAGIAAWLTAAAIAAVAGDSARLARYPVTEAPEVVSGIAVCAQSANTPAGRLWQGRLARLEAALRASGWSPAPEWTLASTLQWLSPEPHAAALPTLPRVAGGRFVTQVWVRSTRANERTVLRLWWRAPGKPAPVWRVGAVHEHLVPRWPLLRVDSRPAELPEAALNATGRLCPRRPASAS